MEMNPVPAHNPDKGPLMTSERVIDIVLWSILALVAMAGVGRLLTDDWQLIWTALGVIAGFLAFFALSIAALLAYSNTKMVENYSKLTLAAAATQNRLSLTTEITQAPWFLGGLNALQELLQDNGNNLDRAKADYETMYRTYPNPLQRPNKERNV